MSSWSFTDYFSPLSDIIDSQAFRIFVSTWNVGGNSPCAALSLNDFLPLDDESDIYVLGFQEIVPLNAGNVLSKAKEPAAKWVHLIDRALNRPAEAAAGCCPATPSIYQTPVTDCNPLGTKFSLFRTPVCKTFNAYEKRKVRVCNCPRDLKKSTYKRRCSGCHHPSVADDDVISSDDGEGEEKTPSSRRRYSCIVEKKMVGIFVTIWAKMELVRHVSHLQISCVCRGLLGRLGNKGCISVSMSLHQTSFCFICCHLASGEKEGDELRRNSDVMEIMKSTTFRRICKNRRQRNPAKILDHDQVIWFGDLNYRIALNYSETKRLVVENNWDALLEKDQLRNEREAGRVFDGWSEGKIFFPPTYKYSNNSDMYWGENVTCNSKRRTPSWCDRILWHGDGISQLFYIRGESKLSDHRPVFAVFSVDVRMLDDRFRKEMSTINMKVGVEELLPSI